MGLPLVLLGFTKIHNVLALFWVARLCVPRVLPLAPRAVCAPRDLVYAPGLPNCLPLTQILANLAPPPYAMSFQFYNGTIALFWAIICIYRL